MSKRPYLRFHFEKKMTKAHARAMAAGLLLAGFQCDVELQNGGRVMTIMVDGDAAGGAA